MTKPGSEWLRWGAGQIKTLKSLRITTKVLLEKVQSGAQLPSDEENNLKMEMTKVSK